MGEQSLDERDAQDATLQVILPSTSLAKTMRALRRSTLGISNRLRSILADSEFVAGVSKTYQLPLVANLRCGEWYARPEDIKAHVYFKSTDGHSGQWAFSFRRLNLQIFDVLSESGGCIIVDSTRRGKLMPDALSKTIPMWCSVMNRLLFPKDPNGSRLHTPEECVSASEHEQMADRLEDFISRLIRLELDVDVLRSKISKPLKPIWVCQSRAVPQPVELGSAYTPIILCTASLYSQQGDLAADGYIQGAGDDNENWSLGLTPRVFWQYRERIMSAPESQLPKMIEQLLLARALEAEHDKLLVSRAVGGHEIYVGCNTLLDTPMVDRYNVVVHCDFLPHLASQQKMKSRYFHIKCRKGKVGCKDLRSALLELPQTFPMVFQSGKVLVCSQKDSDLRNGIALYLVCQLELEQRRCLHTDQGEWFSRIDMTKEFIEQQVARISSYDSTFQLSRSTLLAARHALMSGNNHLRT